MIRVNICCDPPDILFKDFRIHAWGIACGVSVFPRFRLKLGDNNGFPELLQLIIN
jgi:hypothetical protein